MAEHRWYRIPCYLGSTLVHMSGTSPEELKLMVSEIDEWAHRFVFLRGLAVGRPVDERMHTKWWPGGQTWWWPWYKVGVSFFCLARCFRHECGTRSLDYLYSFVTWILFENVQISFPATAQRCSQEWQWWDRLWGDSKPKTSEQWKKPWLFRVYRGLYCPVIWGL